MKYTSEIYICTKDFPVNFKLSENLAGDKHWIKALNLLFYRYTEKSTVTTMPCHILFNDTNEQLNIKFPRNQTKKKI